MNLTTEEEIPQVLYKYRGFSESTRDYVRQIIVENKVWFSSPADLNDPFDCKVHASFKGTVREYKKDMLRLLKKYNPSLNRQQRQAENARIFKEEKRHKKPDLFSNVVADVQKEYDRWGVYCLSVRNDNILMWSHYANGHKGICLGFGHRPARPLGPAFPVMYSPELPRVSYLEGGDVEKFRADFLTKDLPWEHEREWRVIDRNRGRGFRQFPPESLVEIILGAQMTQEDRAVIISWIEARPLKPSLFEARARNNAYELEIHLITPGTAARGAA
jgi:Protein of unknown function (DUF2971)